MTVRAALDIARALIACPSVTPEDAGALPYLRDVLAEARLRGRTREILRAGHARRPQSLRALRDAATESRLRRPRRRRAAGRRLALALSPVLSQGGGRSALGPGRCGHEGRRRGGGRGGALLRRPRALRRIDQLSRHRRRGGPVDQRHGEAARLGADEGRTIRPLHRRRADLRRRARRHDQERPARLADGAPDPAWTARPCRLSAYRGQSGEEARAGARRAHRAAARSSATRTSTRRTSRSSRSTSAMRRPMSFRARSGSSSMFASTTSGRRGR